MNHFLDKRLQRITEQLSDSEEKRLHARIEIDNRDELLRETAELIKRLAANSSCECSPPCKIENMSWFECKQFKECLLKDDCMPCLYCEARQIIVEIEVMANKLGNWFDDPVVEKLRNQLEDSFSENNNE